MKRILIILIGILTIVSCHTIKVESFSKELSEFAVTKSSEPLNQTIWECEAKVFNKYLYFTRDSVSLFYGTHAKGELQRWSDFFTAPYKIDDGYLVTNLNYKEWNEKEVNTINIVKSNDSYYMNIDGDIYTLTNYNPTDIEGFWMTINVDIVPWN